MYESMCIPDLSMRLAGALMKSHRGPCSARVSYQFGSFVRVLREIDWVDGTDILGDMLAKSWFLTKCVYVDPLADSHNC